ncbi:hypothetical protein [Mastigocoleus testarum]|uniref:hypothetical protein n=1 Tax=Mastigocoleus testarum TaxID=996925 RepID=UPI00040D5E22|nr:hypothetical protein [Mastigocoleus testarum]
MDIPINNYFLWKDISISLLQIPVDLLSVNIVQEQTPLSITHLDGLLRRSLEAKSQKAVVIFVT